MAKFKQKSLVYLLFLAFLSGSTSFPILANAAGTSMQSYDRSRPVSSYTETENELRYFRMIGDLLIGRPLLLVATGLGTGIFLASLPFSVLGGNVKEAADTLVVSPARQTFVRCLGCRISAFGSNQHPDTPEDSMKEEAPHTSMDKHTPFQGIPPTD